MIFIFRCSLLISVWLIVVSAAICQKSSSNTRLPSNNGIEVFKPPSKVEVDRAIDLAAAYMQRVCGGDGRFIYKVDIETGTELESYNIVRHAGAIYALSLIQQAHPSKATASAILRAAGYLRQNYIRPGMHSGMLAVWSKPNSLGSDAELGATGLGLVALTEARKTSPDSVPLSDLQALGRFLLFLQRDDGSFVSKYSEVRGAESHFESLYYPGEAALGLLYLYDADRSPIWIDAAIKALRYLARIRKALMEVPADNWALIATAKLLSYCESESCKATYDEFIPPSVQICTSILKEEVRSQEATGLDGSLGTTGRITPTATRLEGILAVMPYLPDENLHSQADIAVTHGIAFLLRNQITHGAYAGGMLAVPLNRFDGPTDLRIDYVQHTVSAWVKYRETMSN